MDDPIELRPVEEDDLATVVELIAGDPVTAGEFSWYGWNDRKRWHRRWAENGLLGDDSGTLMVARAQKRLGLVNWRRKTATPTAYHWEIGIALLPGARGHGYGTEAHRLLVRCLFAHTPVHRIEAATETGNLAGCSAWCRTTSSATRRPWPGSSACCSRSAACGPSWPTRPPGHGCGARSG
jgi:RimJ/RimL family protein N-acetyltransferase